MKRYATLLCLPALLFADSKKLSESERIEDSSADSRPRLAASGFFLPRSRKPLPSRQFWLSMTRSIGNNSAKSRDLRRALAIRYKSPKSRLKANTWSSKSTAASGVDASGTTVLQSRFQHQRWNDTHRQHADSNAPGGTSISINFGEPRPGDAGQRGKEDPQVRNRLRSPLIYPNHALDSLPPEIKAAVLAKRVIEGMDRDEVIMSVPASQERKPVRQTPTAWKRKIGFTACPRSASSFVTFNGNKVIKVKEAYAGLGGQTAGRLTALYR